MAQQIEIVWMVLSAVADRCAALTWKDSDGKILAPADWPWEAARLEYRVFGVFLLSHALIHRRHSQDAWDAAMGYCVAQVEEEFGEIEVEGDDFERFVGARVNTYGAWSKEARAKGRQEEEAQGWIRILKNHLLACSSDHPLPLQPPIMIGDFFQGTMLEVHLSSCFTNLLVPMFYRPVVYLCENHRNLLELSPQLVEQLLAEGIRESRRDQSRLKRPGLLGRLFGRL